ncbi:toll-like receptor 6 [Saccostrea cucullata]|uniref:toll-like receptor 6 n=1 Tax=Saccostrea cuccullata TaxID=36930 RepID=UPI002ED13267
MALSCSLTCYFIVLAVYTFVNVTSTPLPTDTKSLVSNKTEENDGYLPYGWDKFCTLKQESDEKIKVFFCHVKKQFSGKWSFTELKEHVNNKTVKYKFEIKCEGGSNISVPWPLKARNVLQLQVESCDLDHYLREYTQISPSNIPDELEVLDIVDSVIIIDIMDMLNIAINISELNKDFDCGHEDTLKRYVFRNITYAFDKSMELYLSSMFNNDLANMSIEVLNTGSEMLPKSRHIKHKCIFNKLEYADLSINTQTSKFHTELSTENAMFPSLRFFNLSNTRLPNLAEAHRKWYRYFQKLEVMDLSHNLFTELEFDPTADVWDIPMLTLNVSYNNISEFKVDKLEELVDMKKLFIDFSHNPLNCSCTEETRQLITYVNDQSKWIQPKYQRYRFMMDLECMYPDDIYGKRLSDLNTEDLNCKHELVERIAVEAVVFLSLLSVALIIVIIILLKFRREIRILTYTRFNIILPCQPIETFENKKFDAFVSYCNHDQEWVTSVFENTASNNPLKNFKFCLHHKDFMPGKTIFDNVIDCVEASRHTVIVLSKHFLNSHYCMYEFHEAFQQSIYERKRHLLVIMMEDIPTSDLPNDLKRCLKTFTYIRKDDKIFIDRLVYALSYKGQKAMLIDSRCRSAAYSNQTSCETDITEAGSDGNSSPISMIDRDNIFPDLINEKDIVSVKNEKNNIL